MNRKELIENFNASMESVESVIPEYQGNDVTASAQDLHEISHNITKCVGEFLQNQNLATFEEDTNNAMVACEGMSGLVNAVAATEVQNLIEQAGIAPEHQQNAAKMVMQTLHKHNSNKATNVWRDHLSTDTGDINAKSGLGNIGELVGAGAAYYINHDTNISTESFGTSMDQATPDLRSDIAVGLMRFHGGITASMINTQATNENVVRYNRTNAEVIDLADASAPGIPLIEMCRDASMVENELVKIDVLTANKVANECLEDGLLVVGEDANIIDLSIDATDIRLASRTPRKTTVSDGTFVEQIQVVLKSGAMAAETFAFDLPEREFNFVWANDNTNDNKQIITKEFSFFLTTGANMANTNPSVMMAEAATDREGIIVKGIISGILDIQFGNIQLNVSVGTTAVNLDGEALTQGLIDMADAISQKDATRYAIDARFQDDEVAKASISGTSYTQSSWYSIRPGRTYLWDYALNENNAQSNIAFISHLMKLGQGKRTLNMVRSTLEYVATATAAIEAGNMKPSEGPSKRYVAGSRVNPRVYTKTLDLAHGNIISNNDFSRADNIRAHTLLFFNALISRINATTFIMQQIAGGSTIHYRCVTTNEILDNCIAQNYQPDHTVVQSGAKAGGVEYSLQLQNGIVLDFVTTTDVSMADTIMGYCWFSPAKSELNFGQNWNCGLLSGHYPVAGGMGGSNHNRIYISSKEQIIPTNPIGFIVTVTNLESSVYFN